MMNKYSNVQTTKKSTIFRNHRLNAETYYHKTGCERMHPLIMRGYWLRFNLYSASFHVVILDATNQHQYKVTIIVNDDFLVILYVAQEF